MTTCTLTTTHNELNIFSRHESCSPLFCSFTRFHAAKLPVSNKIAQINKLIIQQTLNPVWCHTIQEKHENIIVSTGKEFLFSTWWNKHTPVLSFEIAHGTDIHKPRMRLLCRNSRSVYHSTPLPTSPITLFWDFVLIFNISCSYIRHHLCVVINC